MKPFNKVNTIKYTNKKRKEQRLQYLTLGFSCFAMIVSIMFFALAKIEGNKEYKYIDNNYGEHYVGDNIVGAYVDGVKSKNIPGKDSGYYLQKGMSKRLFSRGNGKSGKKFLVTLLIKYDTFCLIFPI